jgi:simple sugar transport system permease protein
VTLAGGLRALAPAAVAAAAAVGLGTLVVLAAGARPLDALAALAAGALGDRFALVDTLVKTTPLLFTGLAVAVAFRSGSWNIGAEGQLLVGALAATAVGGAAGPLPAPLPLALALVAAAVAGGLWASLAAALRVTRNVSEVIATIMLNFVAVQLVGWAVRGPLMEAASRYPQSDPLPRAALLPLLGGRLHAGVALAALLVPVVWALLFRTALGYRWRLVGENPRAALIAGFSPPRAIVGAMLASGALAGLAGGVEVLGVTGRLFDQLSSGSGYTAIAVALLGRLHPGGVAAAAVFFGALAAGSGAMQRVAGVPAVLVAIIQATTIFALLALESPRLAMWRTAQPPESTAPPGPPPTADPVPPPAIAGTVVRA